MKSSELRDTQCKDRGVIICRRYGIDGRGRRNAIWNLTIYQKQPEKIYTIAKISKEIIKKMRKSLQYLDTLPKTFSIILKKYIQREKEI